MKAKKAILIIICVILVALIGRPILGHLYKMNYFSVYGVRLRSSHEAVIYRLGDPIDIRISDDGNFGSFYYDGVVFHVLGLNHISPPGSVDSIWITNPNITLGRHRIGVGSTREEVEQVGWNRWPLFLTRNSFDDAFMVSITHDSEAIWFYFDENDIVYEIRINFNST